MCHPNKLNTKRKKKELNQQLFIVYSPKAFFSCPQFDSSQQNQTTENLIQLLSSRILTNVALISRHSELGRHTLKTGNNHLYLSFFLRNLEYMLLLTRISSSLTHICTNPKAKKTITSTEVTRFL